MKVFIVTVFLVITGLAHANTVTSNKIINHKNKEKNQEKDIFKWFSTYAEVVSLVQKKGFKSVDFAKFIQNSLKSAVSSIDAHSSFFDQDSYRSALEATSGEFSGIGVSVISKTPDDDALAIVGVIRNSPADKVGIKSGDKIVAVNDEKLRGVSSDEVVTKLKGRLGTEVSLKIIRNKKPMEFKVKREIIKDQTSICYYFKNQNVYYLSLSLFTENASKQMSNLLRKANEGKCNGIVLDLRRNPGGTLDSAIDMAGLFLPKNSLVVVTKDNKNSTMTEYRTKSDPMLKSNVPIFILVNNLTASAAEILAGCLAHHSRDGVQILDKGKRKHNLMVFVVGMPTFGKGSVQELIPIKNGCALKLTTMLYFLPKNTSLQAIGIQPDFVIKPKMVPTDEMKWMAEFYGKESSLKNHISVQEVSNSLDKKEKSKKKVSKNNKDKSKNNKEEEKNWEEKTCEDLALDVQVQACVNLINLFDVMKVSNPKILSNRKKTYDFLKRHYLTDDPVIVEKVVG